MLKWPQWEIGVIHSTLILIPIWTKSMNPTSLREIQLISCVLLYVDGLIKNIMRAIFNYDSGAAAISVASKDRSPFDIIISF